MGRNIRYVFVASALAVVVGCAGQPSTSAIPVRIEFRIAHDAPAEGLTEATFFELTNQRTCYLEAAIIASNADVKSARATTDEAGRPAVDVTFRPSGAESMGKATTANIGKRMAIIMDGEVIAAPRIQATVTDAALISGVASKEEARRIADGISVR
jgi:preprotein translocase subunit SecD